MHRNLLEKLPENFGQLSNLRRLDLHGNLLKTLPHAFWQLSRLEWLDLRRNKFEKVDLKAAADVGRRCTEEKGHECAKKVSVSLSPFCQSLSFLLSASPSIPPSLSVPSSTIMIGAEFVKRGSSHERDGKTQNNC